MLIAGIKPADGKYYSLESIKDAIKEATGYTPYIDCNVDASRKYHQLYQVYMCVEASGSEFINCPVLPHGRSCTSQIEFPSFSHIKSSHQELWLHALIHNKVWIGFETGSKKCVLFFSHSTSKGIWMVTTNKLYELSNTNDSTLII